MAKQVIEDDKITLSRLDEDNQLLAIRATPVVKDFSKIVVEAAEKGFDTDVYVETIIEKFVEKLTEVIKSDNIEITTNEDGTELILTAPETIGGAGTNSSHIIRTYSDESNEYQGIAGNQHLRSLDLNIGKDTNCVVQLNLIVEEANNYKGFNVFAVANSGREIELREALYLYNVNIPNILTIEAKFKILANENPDIVKFFIDKQLDDDVSFYLKTNSGWIAWFDGINENAGNSCKCKYEQEMRTYDTDLNLAGIDGEQHLSGFDLLVNPDTDCTVALNLIIKETNSYKGFRVTAQSSENNNIQLMKPIYLFDDFDMNKITIQTKFKIITSENPDTIRFFIDKQLNDDVDFTICKNSSWLATYTLKENSIVNP